MRTYWMAALTLLPSAALGQIVFFDDFQGPELAPHWIAPPPEHWDYNFSGGMLNITGLHYPSLPHSSTNWASMAAHVAPQTDFRADIWMGWDASQSWHRLTASLLGPQARGLAFFTYVAPEPTVPYPIVEAGASNQYAFSAAPSPGIHHFTISRTGSQFDFLLNGQPFASFADQFGTPLTTVFFVFTRSYPGDFAPLYIDQVLIVPAPGTGAFAVLIALGACRRRPNREAITVRTLHRGEVP